MEAMELTAVSRTETPAPITVKALTLKDDPIMTLFAIDAAPSSTKSEEA